MYPKLNIYLKLADYIVVTFLLQIEGRSRRSKRMNVQPQDATKDSFEIERRHWMRNTFRLDEKKGEKHERVGKKETEERRAQPCWIVSAIFEDEKKAG